MFSFAQIPKVIARLFTRCQKVSHGWRIGGRWLTLGVMLYLDAIHSPFNVKSSVSG